MTATAFTWASSFTLHCTNSTHASLLAQDTRCLDDVILFLSKRGNGEAYTVYAFHTEEIPNIFLDSDFPVCIFVYIIAKEKAPLKI